MNIESNLELSYSPFEYQRRKSSVVANFGGHEVPRVIADLSQLENISPASLYACGYQYVVDADKWNISDQACDYIFTGDKLTDFDIPGTLGVIVNHKSWDESRIRNYPLYSFNEFNSSAKKSKLKDDCLSGIFKRLMV